MSTAGLCACAPVAPDAGPGSGESARSIVLAALAAPDAAARAVVLDAVGLAHRRAFLPAVVAAGTDADPLVRAAALRARLRLDPTGAAADLRALAADPGNLGRALTVVGDDLPEDLVADVLDAASRADAPAHRASAVEGAEFVSGDRRRRLLDRALADPDPQVRRVGATVAARLGVVDAGPGLVVALMDGPHEHRLDAARRLGELGEVCALPALLHVAARDEGPLREVATASLCRLGHDASCGALRPAVASREAGVAGPAIEALAALGGAEARGLLAVAVAHPEVEVRLAAAEVLGRTESTAERRVLLPLLADERAEPRALAAAALVDLEPARAFAVVFEAARGSNPGLRARLVEVLERRYRRWSTPASGRALAILAGLADEAKDVAVTGADLPVALTALGALLSAGPALDRSLFADAALRHPAPEIRYLAARAVAAGDVEDPGSALDAALGDPVVSVRVAAAVARLAPD